MIGRNFVRSSIFPILRFFVIGRKIVIGPFFCDFRKISENPKIDDRTKFCPIHDFSDFSDFSDFRGSADFQKIGDPGSEGIHVFTRGALLINFWYLDHFLVV